MPVTGEDIEQAGNGIKNASEGASTLLDSLGKFFAATQRYWKGLVILFIVGTFLYQWHLIGTEYSKGYKTAKSESDDYILSQKTSIEYKDKRIKGLQKENDTLFKMWNECRQATYSQIIFKTKQQ